MYRYFTKHAVPVLMMEWQNCLIKYIKITSSKYFHWLQGCPDLGSCHLFRYSWESTKITREPTEMLQQHGSMSTESRWPKVCFHSSHLSYKEIYSLNKYFLFVIVDTLIHNQQYSIKTGTVTFSAPFLCQRIWRKALPIDVRIEYTSISEILVTNYTATKWTWKLWFNMMMHTFSNLIKTKLINLKSFWKYCF